MINFNSRNFLRDYNIVFYEKGKNVSKNYFGTACPFCGDSLTGVRNHLGIHHTNGHCKCWKCGGHSLWSTIKALVPSLNPKEIIEQYGIYTDEVYDVPLADYTIKQKELIVPGTTEFKEAHKNYLRKRGLDADYIIKKYNLQVTGSIGPLRRRIIFPITWQNTVVSYQGRAYDGEEPRYITCSPELERLHHKDIFFGIENLASGQPIVVVEGVFDQIVVGGNTVASFGTSITPTQINLLASKRPSKVFMLYDAEEEAQILAKKACRTISAMGIPVENVNLGNGDPGSLCYDDVLLLKKELGVF